MKIIKLQVEKYSLVYPALFGSEKKKMSSSNLAVLNALDTARTQWYHFTAIVIAGMGFFTDAYDLFCISNIAKLLGRLYYTDPSSGKPGKLPHPVNNS